MDSAGCLCTDLACDLHPRPLAPLSLEAEAERVKVRIRVARAALSDLRARTSDLDYALFSLLSVDLEPSTARLLALDAMERAVSGLLGSVASARGAL